MKWRIVPDLKLEEIQATRCLLLGAGTLGSYVARGLLAWGVRKITLVDNATVSFSNPVRQPLFRFEDSLEGGKQKAPRAAESLRDIYPGVDATGHVLSIPMIGHPITDEKGARQDFNKLVELFEEHDAIFLLMDSRESRWLPTVMGAAGSMIVINVALGFDTYVVLRHGVPTKDAKDRLGCYFCNDVVAPTDSLTDRTLDQMCTVTRPGLAAIASGLAVELLASIVQHEDCAAAPAPKSAEDPSSAGTLGLVPHQLRGFLARFNTMAIRGSAYDCCSACSDTIVDKYKQEGWDFVSRALNQAGYVEELSGLKEVQRRATEAAEQDEGFAWSEEEDGF